MLHKSKSKREVLIKYGLALPLLGAMLILSSAVADIKLGAGQTPGGEKNNPLMFSIKNKSDSVQSLASVDVLPEFPGGQKGWGTYLSQNLKYPEEAKKQNITGRVIAQFIVQKDGSLSDLKILRGIGAGCDQETLRVLKNSPKWIPGTKNGKKVAVSYIMPIVFTMTKISAKDSIPPPPAPPEITKPVPPPPPALPKTALYIKDGKEITFEEMQQIPNEKIESVKVWKGKEAMDRYGAKAKNGVVVISLKK